VSSRRGRYYGYGWRSVSSTLVPKDSASAAAWPTLGELTAILHHSLYYNAASCENHERLGRGSIVLTAFTLVPYGVNTQFSFDTLKISRIPPTVVPD
jgi:hypothetical protein